MDYAYLRHNLLLGENRMGLLEVDSYSVRVSCTVRGLH